MSEPKISIIIPAFNVEQYIQRCLESILRQTYTEWEVILIDDGSTDSTGIICDDYAAHHSRIKVIHKDNGGVSSARNIGIEASLGDWITFVDGDDALLPDAISRFVDGVKGNPDILMHCFKFIRNNHGNLSEINQYTGLMTADKFFEGILNYSLYPVPFAKLFHKSIAKRFSFDSRLKIGEDLIYNLRCADYSKVIEFHNANVYEYVEREGSAMGQKNLTEEYVRLNGIIEEIYLNKEIKVNKSIIDSFITINLFQSYFGRQTVLPISVIKHIKTLSYDLSRLKDYTTLTNYLKLIERCNHIGNIYLNYLIIKSKITARCKTFLKKLLN